MSTDRETTRIVRSWLRRDEHESADRLLGAVLDRINTTPQRRAAWWPTWRFPVMNTPMRWGVAAVAVAVLALAGISYFGGRGVGIPMAATPTPSASALATPEGSVPATPVVSGSLPTGGQITQGSYVVADPFPVEMILEVEPGWSMWGGGVGTDVVAMYRGSPDPPAGNGIIFVTVGNTYADVCDASAGGMTPQVGRTVDDLATALVAQASTESTDPVPVTIDGYDGVYLDYRNTGECGTISRWPTERGDRVALGGERDQVWILDVDGTRLVIDAFSFSLTTDVALEEMRRMVEGLDLGTPAGG